MRTRISICLIRILVLSLLILSCLDLSCSRSKSFPHVLIITIDGLRPDHLSCYGYQKLLTPHIDRIADKGVRFEHAITPSPLTLPGHASLFTGLYPYNHGVRCEARMKLDEEFQTLAEILRDKGYETAAVIGSTFLHHQFGLDQGFDDYHDDFSEGLYFDAGALKLKGKDVTIHGIKRLQARFRQKPMFLWINYADLALIKAKTYDLMLQYIDAHLGKLLDEIPPDQPALIVITSVYASDLSGQGGIETGYSLDESSIKVPMILSGPGIPQGKISADKACITDIIPTILELLKIPQPENLDGKSLVPAISAEKVSQRRLYIETAEPYCSMGWPGMRAILDEKKSGLIQAPLGSDPDPAYFQPRPGQYQPEPEQARNILRMLGQAQEHELKSEYTEAEKLLKQVLEENPENLQALTHLAWIYLNSDRVPQARELFIRAREIRTDDPQAITGLAACALLENDLDSAGTLFTSLRVHPVLPREYYLYYGKLLAKKAEPEDAASMFEQAVSLDPLDKEAYLLLGQALAAQGNTREAVKKLERAIVLDPEYLPPYQELLRIQEQVLKNSIKTEAYREKIKKLMRQKE
jgi:choline-sulfatase